MPKLLLLTPRTQWQSLITELSTICFFTFSIKVMSRGSVVSTGQITSTSFDITITDKMAPNARLIVYYVRADGEIVTDSISFDVDGAFLNQVMPCT